jgi:brefeldin A-inhibited guanine nucleotide-exchange protein
MRSKLLALRLVITTLKSNAHIFTANAPVLFVKDAEDCAFIYSVRQFLCLSFTRNITSTVPMVFQLSVSLFTGILLNLRSLLKVYVN